jgi:hypothetical protein
MFVFAVPHRICAGNARASLSWASSDGRQARGAGRCEGRIALAGGEG